MKSTLLIVLSSLFLGLHAQTYNYYFGNLHAHTGFSDGCQDSTTSGVSNPTGAYAFAKATQHLDFLGISEHNHFSSTHNPGFKLPLYQQGLNLADSANNNPNFLTLFGMEWGVTSTYNGHVVIYGFNQLIGWEYSVPGVTGNNYNIYNGKTDYDGLFRKVKNNPNAFCYLAHPNTTDYTTNGTAATALANSPYNAMWDSAIVGTPLRSGYAFSTSTNYGDYTSGDYFSYYKKLLSIGYHIGIGYDHDNHNTTFGRNNAGRLVILAPSLTRANLVSAMQQMHFYGSDDWNAKIDFNMNGNMMGSILTGSTAPTFNVVHDDGDAEQATIINIWRGNKNMPSPVVVNTTYNNNTLTYTDPNLSQGVEYFYFAEIRQADGNWIVTSPIWYKSTQDLGTVGVKEETEELHFNYFPNPVSGLLSISMAREAEYQLNISDVSGREVLSSTCTGNSTTMDLSALQKGVYLLTVRSAHATVTRKLIVE